MTKREHFIPRAAYLRHFSDTHNHDDRQNTLGFYNVHTKKSGRSNVYDLGYENYLYEDKSLDFNSVEQFLSEIESDLCPEIAKLIGICSSSCNNNALVLHGKDEKDNLKLFMTLQFFRTPKMRDSYDCAEEIRSSVFLGALIGKNDDGEWWIKHNIDALSNHFFVFERNETPIPFVIPDHPISIMKAKEDEHAFNFRFPLTPFLQVLLIDPESEDSINQLKFRNRIRIIPQELSAVVDEWNHFAVSEAKRFVYYPPNCSCRETPAGVVFRQAK